MASLNSYVKLPEGKTTKGWDIRTSGHPAAMYDYQSPKYAHNMFHGMYNDIHIYSFIQDPDFSLLWIVEKKTLSNYCHWFMQV